MDAAPFSAGAWSFNTPHTYAALFVAGQDNGGAGYMQSYVDGQPFFKVSWSMIGNFSRLNTQPLNVIFGMNEGGASMTLGRTRIFVKDVTRITPA